METGFENKTKKLVKNTLIYTVSNFGSKVLTFLIVPLYTYYLTTSEYGTYDTIISIVGLVAPLCILAINEGLLRWLLKSEESEEMVISTGFTLYFVFVGITILLLGLGSIFFHWEYSLYFIFLLAMMTLYTVLQFSARGAKRNRAFASSGVIYTFIMLALNLLLIIVIKMGIKGMLLSMGISYMLASIFLIWCLRDVLFIKKYEYSKSLARDMIVYSIMLVPNNISWWIMNASDRIMLTAMIGSAATGIYSIACKFPTIVSTLHTIFYQAWQEQAVLEYDSESRDRYYTMIFNSYMKLAFSIVVMLIPFSKLFIQLFMSEAYKEAYVYIGILYLGAIFSSFSGFYGTGYISAKDTKNAMRTTLVGAIVNIAINVILIPTIGVWAACVSTLVGYSAVYVIRVIQTRKYFKIQVDRRSFIILLAISVAYCVAIPFSNRIATVAMLIGGGLIALCFNQSIIKDIVSRLRKRNANAIK